MFLNDPTKFEQMLAPVAGDVAIRPVSGSLFNAEINMKKLDRVGLFSVSANSFRAAKEPQEEFYGLTIPLSAPFGVSSRGRHHEYQSSSAHLLTSGHAFNLITKRNAHFLATAFFAEPVHQYSQKLFQTDSLDFSLLKPKVMLSRDSYHLLRSVARAWSVLNSTLPAHKIIYSELEDDLLASFALHANKDSKYDDEPFNHDSPCHLSYAEDYIFEHLSRPITRDQLAEVSGRSIRTLSRAFEKKYGIGPMAFIKQRRLDAAYLDLLSAEPDVTTVAQVAINYGFAHTGKFAIEYGKAFRETPSTTLSRW